MLARHRAEPKLPELYAVHARHDLRRLPAAVDPLPQPAGLDVRRERDLTDLHAVLPAQSDRARELDFD
jgi:hypothetical protein